MSFDIKRFQSLTQKSNRYERRLRELKKDGRYVQNIETVVGEAIRNIKKEGSRSFVVYGEPQSGKTELMIALTARLLDEGYPIVVVLLNDNLQLLSQNLDRFKRSGLDPSPRNFSEVLDDAISLRSNEWVIFCKKNARDLTKLIDKLGRADGLIVLDDEADYATPNSTVNKQQKTKINDLVGRLLGKRGVYIGVTATPARLDLNNTYNNQKERWVVFPPHPEYKGQSTFFPTNTKGIRNREFKLNLLPSTQDSPRYLREALFRFFISVAYLNSEVSTGEENYSILIHTSGKRADHSEDYKVVVKTLEVLTNPNSSRFEKYVKSMWTIAKKQYGELADELVEFVIRNISRNTIVVMNSDIDKKVVDFQSATSPAALFTIAIGGNIVSRGVTFDNLLSMYFTRDVKHKIQQDTYIQRARMFGARGRYLKHFELTIPDYLYHDWHRCFIFHRLALDSIQAGRGSPVWLEDKRISVVSSSSIDKATVDVNRGEMGFELFDYDEKKLQQVFSANLGNYQRLERLSKLVGQGALPEYLIEFIKSFSPKGELSVAFHPVADISGWGDDTDKKNIERIKGFISSTAMKGGRYIDAVHHIKVLHNGRGRAKVFYKYGGDIKMLKNLV